LLACALGISMELCRKPFVSPPPTGYCGKFENISAKQSDEQAQPQKGTNAEAGLPDAVKP